MTNDNCNQNEWNDLFNQYTVNNIRYLTKQINKKQIVEDEDIRLFMSGINFALKLPCAWSLTHNLILRVNNLFLRKGYGSAWMPLLKQAIAHSQTEDDVVEIKLRRNLIVFYRLHDNIAEARQILLESLALFQHRTDLPEYWQLINQAAVLDKLNHNYERAEMYCNQTLSQSEVPPKIHAEALNIKGNAFYEKGEYQSALANYARALDIYRSLEMSYEMGKVFTNRGASFQRLKKWVEAEESYRRAIDCFEQANDEIEKYKVVMNLGNVFLGQKKYEQALKQYNQAKQVFEEKMYNTDLANCLNNIGLAYTGLEDWEEALYFFKEAIKNRRQGDDLYKLANNLDNRAEVFIEMADYGSAKADLLEAKEVLTKVSDSEAQKRLKDSIQQKLDKIGELI